MSLYSVVDTTSLYQFFTQIAPVFGGDPDLMMDYAAEDKVGGFHNDPAQRQWQLGSMWSVEGQAIYAVVRAMKPQQIVEIGTWRGCSTTHILSALKANGSGRLISIDPLGNAGELVPSELRGQWTMLYGKAEEVLPMAHVSAVDLVFEDGPHGRQDTINVLRAVNSALRPRLIISHDGAHFMVGDDVRAAYREVYGVDPQMALIDPADCGFCWLDCMAVNQ